MAPRQVVLAAGIAAGFAVLASLCAWQVARALERERNVELASARLILAPVPLPTRILPEEQELTPVQVVGRFIHAEERHVLTSQPALGPGVRVITPFETAGGRRILVDRGFVPESLRDRHDRPAGTAGDRVAVEGVLSWPRERGFFVPEPDPISGLWFARDVAALAADTGAEELLVIARHSAPGGFPRADAPLGSERRNFHVEYAATWAALAVAWLLIGGMLWRRERAQR